MKKDSYQIHITVHPMSTRMVPDPGKYKGRGRPKKRDYILYNDLIARHIFQHGDYLESLI